MMSQLKPCEKCGRDYYPLRRGYCHRCDAQRRARHGYQCSYVDAGPVRDHVAALGAAGIGLRRLAQLSGLNRKTLTCLLNGRSERGSAPSQRVSARTAQAILAVEIPEVPHHGVAGGQLVDAIGTVRRAQALVAFGYPRSYIASRMGMTPGNATRLFTPTTLRVLASTARKMEILFGELQATPGPSQRARNDGIRNGWDVPLAWDDDELDQFTAVLDEPRAVEEQPAGGVSFDEIYRELRYLGYSDSDIARREGIQLDSLHQRLRRAGSSPDNNVPGSPPAA